MYETIILEKFSSMPVFSLADVSQITKSKAYAKFLLSSLLKKGRIKKIKRDLYTLHEDAFLLTNFQKLFISFKR
jgi:predicted transcriptional regulator of viral defense system